MQGQFKTTGHFATANARKYLVQLCKHFGHKVPATVEGDHGHVTFAMGEARMLAEDDSLRAVLTAPAMDSLPQLQAIIDDHLKRFAFREDFSGMDWAAA